MLAKLLGAADLLAAVSIIFLALGVFKGFAIIMALILIVKSLVFITAFASWIDILAGVFILVSAFYGFNIVLWVAFVWLVQKAVVSFFTY
ncbi:MAG TPA: hypothetical protein VJH95_06490 [Candidatus Nanoarchaeia archaeon]|nr:hypothetical protein [Candidatus Nanoarchaeia archaeon]